MGSQLLEITRRTAVYISVIGQVPETDVQALENGLPVIHVLNTRELAGRTGISFDAAAGRMAPVRVNPWWSLAALALFFGVLLTHERWRLV